MARTLAVKRGPFQMSDRVKLTQEGEQLLTGVGSKTGTVVGLSDHSTLYVLQDGYRTPQKFPAALWRVVETTNE